MKAEQAKLMTHMSKQHVLKPEILVSAYSQGYFPMPEEETGEILWYRPDPRAIFPLDGFKVSRSLRKKINSKRFTITYSQDFSKVVEGCAKRETTWITEDIKEAFYLMHRLHAAHSVEIWQDEHLVGGVYGLSLGGAFFAESMFHYVTDASKIALYYLVERLNEKKFELLECQFLTHHLASLGAIEINDREYIKLLTKAIRKDVYF